MAATLDKAQVGVEVGVIIEKALMTWNSRKNLRAISKGRQAVVPILFKSFPFLLHLLRVDLQCVSVGNYDKPVLHEVHAHIFSAYQCLQVSTGTVFYIGAGSQGSFLVDSLDTEASLSFLLDSFDMEASQEGDKSKRDHSFLLGVVHTTTSKPATSLHVTVRKVSSLEVVVCNNPSKGVECAFNSMFVLLSHHHHTLSRLRFKYVIRVTRPCSCRQPTSWTSRRRRSSFYHTR